MKHKSFRQFLIRSLLCQGGFIKPLIPARLMAPEGDEGGGGGGGADDVKPGEDGKYPKEFVEKLLKEKNNWKTKATATEEELKTLKAAKPPKKEEGGEDENAKALLKAKDEENAALKKKLADADAEKTNAIKMGSLKREFIKNGGTEKSFELVQKLANTDKVLIDEDNGVVYGAEGEMKRIKELAPQLFGKPKVDVKDGDLDANNQHSDESNDALGKIKTQRLTGKTDAKMSTKQAMADFYAANGVHKRA